MKKIILKSTLLLLALLLKFNFAMAANPHFSRVVVFGDSYSDNGNVFKLTGGQSPNATRYYKGRYSDGLVWTEYLAKNFQIDPSNSKEFVDYAYGNAKVSDTVTITLHKPEHNYLIPSFKQQINLFQNQYKQFKNDDLIIVFISANDFFDLAQKEADFEQLAIEESILIKRLIKLKAEHIIVLNGRNVTYAPLTKLVAEKNLDSTNPKLIHQYIKKFRHLIAIYNQKLAKELLKLKPIFFYNVFQFDNKSITQIKHKGLAYTINGKSYQMTNASELCYQNLQGDYQGIAGPVCNNPYNYYFYDRIHTTSYANYLLAKDVYQQFLNYPN